MIYGTGVLSCFHMLQSVAIIDNVACCATPDSYVMQCLVFSCNVECCTLTAMTIFNKFKAHTELVNKKYSFSWEYFFANYGQTQHHTSWQYRVVPKQRED